MKFSLGLAVILLLGFGNSFARDWSLYASAAGHFSVAIPLFNSNGYGFSSYGGYPSLGTQTEIGITNKKWEIYTAYFFISPHTSLSVYMYRYGNRIDARGMWKEKRVILGGRWRLNKSLSEKVIPIVGAGISLGESTYKKEFVHYYSADPEEINFTEHQSRKTGINFGELIEVGFLFRPLSHIEATVLFNGQRFEAGFGEKDYFFSQSHFVVVIPSIQIGVRYLIPMGK